MPQAILYAAYYLSYYTGIAYAVSVFVIKAVIVYGVSMAASKLLRPKMPSLADSLGSRDQMVRSPIAARQIIYGRAKVSGAIVYLGTTGARNEYLHMVVAIAGHEVEEIGDVYFNEDLVLTGAGDGAATGKYAGYGDIYKKLGASGQTAFSQLVTDTASLTNGKWTNDHKLTGIACVYVRLKFNSEIYVGGIPNVSVIVKGKKVFDPRTSTTGYSTNSALCLRDYLTSSLGLGMTSAEIDDTACIVAANECDEQVQILPVSPATYEKRYETNGVVLTSETPDSVIGKLLSAMGGLCAYSGGRLTMYAGTYQVPTLSFNEKHFVGPISLSTKISARDRVNTVKGVYTSEGNQWQPSDFPIITSTTFVTQDNGIRYTRDVALPFTTSASMAQRLAVIELRRARQELIFSAKFRLEAMQIRAGETVMITNAKFGWVNKVFEVMEWKFTTDGEPPTLAVEMTLKSIDSTVYSWTVSDQIAVTAAPNTTLPNPWSVTVPTNLALVADGTTQIYQADGTAISRIRVSWSAPGDEFVRSGGFIGLEWKNTTATTYLQWARVPGDQTQEFIDSGVLIGTTYNVRIYSESYFGVSSSYVSGTVYVAQDTTPPTIPTGLTAVIGTGRAISLDWNDNTEPDFSEYGVWRNTTGDTPGVQQFAYDWGLNDNRQLGLGDTVNRSSPVQIGTSSTWNQLAYGNNHGAGIKNGELWTWGSNVQNQLGIGSAGGSRSLPVQIGTLSNWARVECGVYQTYSLKTDGTLWVVGGDNTYGQLGLNDTASRSSPVQIGTSSTWAQFSAGTFHVAAIKTDGSLYTWGRNNVGQLGQGNTTNLSTPTQVGTGTDWASVLAFGNSTLALKTNNTLWGWGLNTSGQLASGGTVNRSSPVQVGALTTWLSIAAGYGSVFAKTNDGQAWVWGINTNGTLGLGDTTNRSSPIALGSTNQWSSFAAGRGHCLAIKPDGTLWAWGHNNQGQLGLGDITNRSSPIQVGALTDWLAVAATRDGYAGGAIRGSVGAPTGKIAETRASRFVDAEVLPGVTYYYWINAYDRLENVSGFSSRAQATPSSVTAGALDSTPPADPSALTQISSALYIASDGGARALVVVTVPALPARATYQNILYRKNGHATSYEIAAQLSNAANVSAVLDDLTPGVTYDIASQAWSFSNIPSAVVTAAFSPFFAANTPAPATPTGGALSANGVIPQLFPGSPSVYNFGTRVSWNANTEKDLAYYEVKGTATNSDAATDYNWGNVRTTETETWLYNATLPAGYVRLRAVNRAGVASAWVYLGNANSAASTGMTSLGAQEASNVSITGGVIKIPTAGYRGFEANVTAGHIDALGTDFRVYDTTTVETFRVDNATGKVYVAGNRVLSTRYAATPLTLADVIAVLQHHGLSL